jgi:dTDP-L-rhamnose 4-epimerase
MSRILVTGGAGFIGSHLVDALLARGRSVRILDALVPQVHGPQADWPLWVPAGVERLRGDVRDRDTWIEALDGVDAVYHLAAEVGVGQSMYEITRYMEANTMGTAQLLELIATGQHALRKLVVASSMSIYGEGPYAGPDGQVVYPALRPAEVLARRQWDYLDDATGAPLQPLPTGESKPLQPTSIYAISKRDQEEMCLSVGRAYGLPTVALRFFNVYGPRQALSNPYTGVVAIFSSRLLNGKPPLIFEDGRQGRDFVHVSDIVQALVLALDSDAANYEAINVGTGRCLSVLDVADILRRKLNVPVEPQIVQQYRAGDIRCCYADIRKAQRLLGYQPRVRMEDGVEELVQWLQHQTAEDRVEIATRELMSRRLTV